jgi:hypothetical protein
MIAYLIFKTLVLGVLSGVLIYLLKSLLSSY